MPPNKDKIAAKWQQHAQKKFRQDPIRRGYHQKPPKAKNTKFAAIIIIIEALNDHILVQSVPYL